MKYAIVILDGASGEPVPQNGGLTSLEAAHTPQLDALARRGRVGLVHNVPQGLEPSSNVACTSIVGYDPADNPIGRGALELAALGVDLKEDQVALRVNLVNVSPEGLMHSYSTDNISTADAHALADELLDALPELQSDTFRLYKGIGFRLYLVVTGHPELMAAQLPAAHNITDQAIAEYPPMGSGSALIAELEARAHAILAASSINARRVACGKLPATHIFIFWPGRRPVGLPSFESRYYKRAAMLSGVDLLNGIAQLTGIKRYSFTGVTDGPDNDYAAQGEGALKMLEANDVAFIHVEAPDAEGHDGHIEGKRLAIEAIDREIISRLSSYGEQHPLRILALPDHPTPVLAKRHSSDPVPFVMAGPGVGSNGAARLTELAAAATGLVVDPGWRLLGDLFG
ncbi:MAG: 2,3-bisphosphoglycerate-independent phosphoglycerate mutase [Coriobacteriales bacterium]|jgi:2,3-bisphosphoglycerate-independent phosphoglycerate mutase|nr:2,3-bisphosphoglycerate-independent phosphoglycerate mutase [Coriobacteriales bacterium]